MQPTVWEMIGRGYESLVFAYGIVLLAIYALLAVFSLLAIRRYLRRDRSIDFGTILESPLAPGISVVAPAFNEGLTIISNVRSLLTLNYPLFEVVIINDGSTDNTLIQMIEEFQLKKVDFAYDEKIRTMPVRGLYKSENPAYNRLLVIDKVNGKAKADAVNAGINASSFPYFLCTDVDCILHKDTLLKLIKPIMDEGNTRVIATGATLRMVNSCEVDEGVVTRVRPPRNLLARFQEMEYIRAFVLGKMGWSFINAVPNVSGGLGMFDKEIAVKAGGYDAKSFGEDMELVTRMCRFMLDNKQPYAIRSIPETLCWTEGPTTLKVFMRQRTRWSRGLAQLMFAHRRMFFNPSYGKMGWLVYPYNFFFELLAPIIEITGMAYYIMLIIMGQINWPFAVILLILCYSYSIMIATLAVLWDQLTSRYYKTWKEVLYVCSVSTLEMILYHPLVVLFAIRGYYFFLTNRKHSWGNMQRQGFGGQKKTTAPAA